MSELTFQLAQDLGDATLPDIQCKSVEECDVGVLLGPKMMLQFWEGSRSWLAHRGVHLYETSDQLVNGVESYSWLIRPPQSTSNWETRLPYATCAPPEANTSGPLRVTIDRLGFAEDSQHRSVVVKLVEPGSDHYRILRRLLKDEAFSDPSTFPCVLPPVALLDTPYNYSFMIMPRWGEHGSNTILTIDRVCDALRFMECMLQGLVFLHKCRIVHRDIHEVNMMVNYYRFDQNFDRHNADLCARRQSHDVSYALMDFDQSTILPVDTCIRACRRPATESHYGAFAYKPWDTALGEPTYNPFAYDVGMLGNVFRWHLAGVVSHVPACAALFDKMTTWVVAERFTAQEALKFLRNTVTGLDNETLNSHIKLELSERVDVYWTSMSPEMLETWSSYRAPPPTQMSYVLEWFLQFRITRSLILTIRRVLNI